MTPVTTTGAVLVDRVLSGASLLDSLHAGAELRSRVAAEGGAEADRLLGGVRGR